MLRGYFPEASVARLEAGTHAAPVAAVVFDLLKGSVTIESKGVVAATFTERLCTLSDLRSDTMRAGSLYLTGNQLKTPPTGATMEPSASTTTVTRRIRLTSGTSRCTTANGALYRSCRSAGLTDG